MPSLKQKYMPILAGYERILSIKESDIELNELDLQIALHDYNACIRCKGPESCSTYHGIMLYNKHTYYDLNRKALMLYKKLHFCLFQCPGPMERKLQISRRLTSRRDDVPSGFYEYVGEEKDPFIESR